MKIRNKNIVKIGFYSYKVGTLFDTEKDTEYCKKEDVIKFYNAHKVLFEDITNTLQNDKGKMLQEAKKKDEEKIDVKEEVIATSPSYDLHKEPKKR